MKVGVEALDFNLKALDLGLEDSQSHDFLNQ